MKLLALPALLALLHCQGAAAAAAPGCPVQTMPPAIDSAGELPPSSHVISFAAEPWQHPRRAWVVRLSSRGRAGTSLEIVRLRGQSDCNRWDVDGRWTAPIGSEAYKAVAQAVERLGNPPADLVSNRESVRDGLVLDGTPIALRLEASGWSVSRTLNHYGPGGAELSAVFHGLVSKHVPEPDLPEADWRSRPPR